MRFFFDTEFSERGADYPIQLISIGIKSEDGRRLYEVSSEFDADACNDWVKANVLTQIHRYPPSPALTTGHPISRAAIAKRIIDFVGDDKPEFWAYYADYDWVVLCQLFGTMIALPDGWPMYCRDIKQLCDSLGNPRLPAQFEFEHHALEDAVWSSEAFAFLTNVRVT